MAGAGYEWGRSLFGKTGVMTIVLMWIIFWQGPRFQVFVFGAPIRCALVQPGRVRGLTVTDV